MGGSGGGGGARPVSWALSPPPVSSRHRASSPPPPLHPLGNTFPGPRGPRPPLAHVSAPASLPHTASLGSGLTQPLTCPSARTRPTSLVYYPRCPPAPEDESRSPVCSPRPPGHQLCPPHTPSLCRAHVCGVTSTASPRLLRVGLHVDFRKAWQFGTWGGWEKALEAERPCSRWRREPPRPPLCGPSSEHHIPEAGGGAPTGHSALGARWPGQAPGPEGGRLAAQREWGGCSACPWLPPPRPGTPPPRHPPLPRPGAARDPEPLCPGCLAAPLDAGRPPGALPQAHPCRSLSLPGVAALPWPSLEA